MQSQTPVRQQWHRAPFRRLRKLLQMVDKYTGEHRYDYDALGRLTRAREEHFAFDPAHNLLSDTGAAPLHDNRLRVYEDKRWDYDNFGNVTAKHIARHTTQRFRWNAEHQLAESVTVRNGAGQRTTYGYDAFGRRSWKQDAFGVTTFVWDGNRLLSESRGGRSHLWIYEDDSFAPLAQISLGKGDTEHDAEVYWYHNDVSGMPRELTGAGGEIAWRAEYRAWGNVLRVEHIEARAGEPVYQPLRYQGQYFDAETGLHYNRFRYYDPDAGRFISQDPIGLAGGINLYQYAPNPLVWVDPLGLARSRAGKQARLRALADDPKQPSHIRGWVKQDINMIAEGRRKTIRNPPGYDLAHWRGYESAKGFSYEYSEPQIREQHRAQHRYDNGGRKNKIRVSKKCKQSSADNEG